MLYALLNEGAPFLRESLNGGHAGPSGRQLG